MTCRKCCIIKSWVFGDRQTASRTRGRCCCPPAGALSATRLKVTNWQLLLWLPSLFTQSYEELHAAEAFPLADAPECDGKEVGGFWVVERACVRCVPMCVCVGVSVCNNDRHSIGIPSVRRSSVDQDSSRVTSCKRAARHSHAAPSDCHPPAIRLLKRRPLVGGPQETNFVHIPGSFLLGGARRATSEPLPPVCFISSSPRNLFGFTSFPAASAIR